MYLENLKDPEQAGVCSDIKRKDIEPNTHSSGFNLNSTVMT